MGKQAVVKASEGHRTFGKLLRRVYGSDEHLIVERDGFPVAVLLSYQEYQALQEQQNLAALEAMNRELNQEADRQKLTDEDFLQELREVRKEMFAERYGQVEST